MVFPSVPSLPERFSEGGDAPIPAERVALIVAHPDDETIGVGAQLPRLHGLTFVLLTDGAPRNLDYSATPFTDAAHYAATRAEELDRALALANVRDLHREAFGIADQDARNHLPDITHRLVKLFRSRRISVALTHAYEGGHPDHDSAAFCVRAAQRMMALDSGALDIIEMPYYRIGPSGRTHQDFAPDPERPETIVRLSQAQQALKRAMLDAHVSQRAVTASFAVEIEQFRVAPAYDFTRPPNDGRLLYENFNWGSSGRDWLRAAEKALQDLGLTP